MAGTCLLGPATTPLFSFFSSTHSAVATTWETGVVAAGASCKDGRTGLPTTGRWKLLGCSAATSCKDGRTGRWELLGCSGATSCGVAALLLSEPAEELQTELLEKFRLSSVLALGLAVGLAMLCEKI